MQVVVSGNRLIDVMCSGTDAYTSNPTLPWTFVSQPFSFINITGLSFTGNTITATPNCAADQVHTLIPEPSTLQCWRMI